MIERYGREMKQDTEGYDTIDIYSSSNKVEGRSYGNQECQQESRSFNEHHDCSRLHWMRPHEYGTCERTTIVSRLRPAAGM
jgi:hypothetical protein